jgi:hypothetical protein
VVDEWSSREPTDPDPAWDADPDLEPEPERDRVAGFGPFLGGIASGMVLIGLIWVIMTGGGSGSGGSGDSGQPPGDTSASGQADIGGAAAVAAGGAADAASTTLGRCTTAAERLGSPLDAAKAAVAQWAVHVGAMNQLVTGSITLPQATAFWNRTRVGAYRRIAAFDTADRALRRSGVDCPAPALLGTRSSPALRACSRHVAALTEQLDAARTAISTWADHVQAMDMLRMGKLSPARATQMWLSMWQRGTDQIDRYSAAARAAARTPGCEG